MYCTVGAPTQRMNALDLWGPAVISGTRKLALGALSTVRWGWGLCRSDLFI